METKIKISEQKDGRLRADYRFVCDRQRNHDDHEADYAEFESDKIELPETGRVYKVGLREYVGPNRAQYYSQRLVFVDDDGAGWGGNSDPSIRRYHGWRGTTDDEAFYGMGVRRCLVIRNTGKRSRRIVIVFGRDLKLDQA